MYRFKDVLCLVDALEWLYMMNDPNGTVVYSYELSILDKEDEKAAKSFGWTEEEIERIRV